MKRAVLGVIALATTILSISFKDANAQDFWSKLTFTAEKLPESLSERSEIDQLTAFVWNFHAARVELAVEGYERSPEFQRTFYRMFSAYLSRAARGNFGEITLENRDRGTWEAAYESGSPKLSKLLEAAREKDHWLADMEKSRIEQNQFKYCLLVYSENREFWTEGLKMSDCIPITLK